MQYSPKLKVAAQQIKKILKDADIAGIVVLHTPGFGEYIYEIDPDYSCAFIDGELIRVRTNPTDTQQKKKQIATDTYNMLDILSSLAGRLSLNTINALEMMKKYLENESDDPGTHTSETQQNN